MDYVNILYKDVYFSIHREFKAYERWLNDEITAPYDMRSIRVMCTLISPYTHFCNPPRDGLR